MLSSILARQKYKKSGGGWYLIACPCHRDDSPSLGIKEKFYTTKSGQTKETIAVKCFAGCDSKEVKATLLSDSYVPVQLDDSAFNKKKDNIPRKIVCTYPYYDLAGKLVYEVVRFEPKSFGQRRYDSKGTMIWGISAGTYFLDKGMWKLLSETDSVENLKVKFFGAVKPMLYNFNNVKAGLAKNPQARVFIVGGEKDVETLSDNGFLATTNSGGENNWQGEEYAESFRNLNVVVIPDNDLAGYAYLHKIAESILPICSSFKVLRLNRLQQHEDVTDWLNKYNGSADALKSLVTNSPDLKDKGVEFIKNVYNYVPPSTDSKEEIVRKIHQSLIDEAAGIDTEELKWLGLCEGCRGTGYAMTVNADGFEEFFVKEIAHGDEDTALAPEQCYCQTAENAAPYNY